MPSSLRCSLRSEQSLLAQRVTEGSADAGQSPVSVVAHFRKAQSWLDLRRKEEGTRLSCTGECRIRQPNYPDALKGIANPRGGPATVLEHTEGDTRSIWTSWTEDPITASDFALNGANKGVVLRYTFSRSSLTPSPNRYGELEWLVPFPVEGAEPTIVTKASPLAQW